MATSMLLLAGCGPDVAPQPQTARPTESTQTDFGDLEVPAGVAIPLQLQVPFTGAAITPSATLTFTAGLRYFVYAIGSVSGGTFDFIVQAVQ
jgi:hypothetical protein